MTNETIAVYYVGGFAKVVADFFKAHNKNIEIVFVSHNVIKSAEVNVILFDVFVKENESKNMLLIIPSDYIYQRIYDLCQQSGYDNIVDYAEYMMSTLVHHITIPVGKNVLSPERKSIAINLPSAEVYRKHYIHLPELLEQKGFSVVLFSNKALNDNFEKNHAFIQIDHPFLIYLYFYHFDVLITDNNLLPSFAKQLHKTKKVYLPHGWVGLAERKIDSQMRLDDIKNNFEHSIFNIFDFLFMPNKQTLEFFTRCFSVFDPYYSMVLIPGGYNSLDLANQNKELAKNKNSKATILYSPGALPSGSPHGSIEISFPLHSQAIITALLANFPTHQIIFRPHPASLNDISIAHAVDEIIKQFENFPLFIYDQNQSHQTSFNQADVMISDSSTSAYTYAFSMLKPVIFFLPKSKEKLLLSIGGQDFTSLRYDIGNVVVDVEEMILETKRMLLAPHSFKEKIKNIRDQEFFNHGYVMQYFTEHIQDIIDNNCVNDWVYLTGKVE